MSLEGVINTDTLSLLTGNETINCEIVEKILVELVEKLTEAQDRLELTKKRNLPKIEEIKMERKEIVKEISTLKAELNELNAINPLNTLEKRRNDFKTEGEYISRILNRNIREEFVAQMKKELKGFLDNLLAGPETIDQITAQIHGCDELNEKMDQKGIEGIPISSKTEKLLSIIHKCHSEVFNKLGGGKEAFISYCVDTINFYFSKRIEQKKSSNVTGLPQFIALMLNDLSFAIVFIRIHYGNNAQKLQRIRSEYYKQFVNDQKEEIDNLLQDIPSVKAVKKVSLFLSRLEKVLKPLMLKSDLINCQLTLLNHVQERSWNYLKSLNDIAEDELEGLTKFCQELLQFNFSVDSELELLLIYKKKIQGLVKLFDQSLVEIVNCYHRSEYSNFSLNNSELKGFIEAIFASSQLRNEFIKEIEIGEGAEEGDYF